ncbi:NEDD4-binding protein 2 isoform X2 [Kryptolebias marmoratus]|uniref:NEDD4-binding protein 2 isoform X2 n=1 Tax=Kryptolebias marmoratus TaxID=37003 RepID=UPI0007F881E7|nr:NEDD4-binding protein 2 isoform X2 [Kryptolebias marmoratus]
MPRRKKNGQSPARQPAGPPEGGSLGHNATCYPPLPHRHSDFAMASNFQATMTTTETSSAGKERIEKSMQEMFSHLDPDVIHIVLSECDYKVENAMDSLLELSVAAEVVTPNPPPVSGFERTAAALLSPHRVSEPKAEDAHSPAKSSSPLSTSLLTEELDLLIDREMETLAAQQRVAEEQRGSTSSAEAQLSSFPPLPVRQQALPELLQSSLPAGSREQVANQPPLSGGSVEHWPRASSPLNQRSTSDSQIVEAPKDVLDFSHLTTEVSPDRSRPPLDLAASGRPSAFQVYKKQDPSHALSERTGPTDSDSAAGGARSKVNLLSSDPQTYMSSPWNLAAPAFCPQIHGNQRPAFITPVAQAPLGWLSHTRQASPWLGQGPFGQAPLKPSAAIPKSWALVASGPAPAHLSRLYLQGKVLVLLRGAPGSGKSTLARALLDHNPGGVILSTDAYFVHGGRYCFDPAVLGEAHEWNHKRAKAAFESGANPIIIDNTNMQGWEMKPYVAQALRHGYKVLFREPDTWWKNKPRELERRSMHNVSVEKIRHMLNGYERFVTVQSIMGSHMPEVKQRLLQEHRCPHPFTSGSPCPDLVGQPGLMEGHKKSHPRLFSSLPDVSSLGHSGEAGTHEDASCKSTESLVFQEEATSKSGGLDADDDDSEYLYSQLDAHFEPHHTGDDQRIPDCIVESVTNEDHCEDEMQVAFFESIGQRARRERPSRRSGLDKEEPVDLVRHTDQSDRKRSKHEEAEEGKIVKEEKGSKMFDFVGDWPTDLSLEQRQVRRRERHKEMNETEAEGGASDDENLRTEQSGPDVTELQKLLDLTQTGVVPVQTSSSYSQSLSLSSRDEIERDDEADGSRASSKGELPDCVQDRKTADLCTAEDLRADDWERVKIDNEISRSTEKNTDASETGRELVDFKEEDLKSASVCRDKAGTASIQNEAGREVNLKQSTENITAAVSKADSSHVSETGESPACEGVTETESSGGTQERKQRQGRRSGKQCKLALTFTQNCPASSLDDSGGLNTAADVKDNNTNRVNPEVKPIFNPDYGTRYDPKPDSDQLFRSNSEGQLQPPASLVLTETGRFTQTEPQDFARLWRLNRHGSSDDTAVPAGGQLRDIAVVEGNSSRFVPQPSSAVAAQVLYRVVHEKGSQVEDKELGVTQDRLGSLRILSRHFKLVSFDTLEDLYDKCQQDLEWTTNLLLDSGERFFRDEEEEEEEERGAADENCNTLSQCGGLGENVGTVKCPEASNQWENRPKGEQTGLEEGILQSMCGTVNGSEPSENTGVVSEGAPVPGTNEKPSGTASDLEKTPQIGHPEAEQKFEQSITADHKPTPEPGPEGLARGGSVNNEEEIADESGTNVQVEIASMDEINRLLQAELEDLEREEEQRKAQSRSQHLDIQTVELKLPTELALQLTELFGPVGLDPGTCSEDDFVVQMDLKMAKLLHQKWKETIQEKQRQAALSFHLLQQSSASGLDGPQDWTQPDDFLMSKDDDVPLVSQPEAGGLMPFMDHWSVSRPHVSLRDIIKEEQALQENVQKSRKSRADLDHRDGAAMLKEKQLFSLFPTIDKHLLQDIFRDHNYSLTQTEVFLRSLLNEEPVKTVVAPEPPRSDHHRAASKEREKQRHPEFTVPNYQDTEDPEYEDFRAEASLQKKRQLESFAKAAEAYKQGHKEVASFYAQQGHLHGQRMREANHRAAVQIFERVNSSLLPRNILDLHGLHVDEALEHLAQVLHDKSADCEQGLCQPQLSVITGRGNHSQGGVARIRPAVIDYLTNKHYRFTEPKTGLMLVSLK